MFDRMALLFGGTAKAAIVAVALLATGNVAGAATVNLDYTAYKDRSHLAQAQGDMTAFRSGLTNAHYEGFEGYKPWGKGTGTQDLTKTAVGSFTPFGTRGSGDAKVGSGTKLQVRSDNGMGWRRYNTTGTDGLKAGNWLDSNDNRGVKWQIKGVGAFDTIGFFISDAADVGGKFSIKVGDQTFGDLAHGKRLKNGNLYFVQIALDDPVNKLTLKLMHDIANDGFGIDGIVVGRTPPAPVPLPPALALLATGLLGAAGLRFRATRKGAA